MTDDDADPAEAGTGGTNGGPGDGTVADGGDDDTSPGEADAGTAEGSETAADGSEDAAEGDEDADERAEDAAGDGDSTDDRVEELEAELADREERIEDLEERLADREEEIEDLETRLKRKQADFQNYKKRAERRREDLKERATEDLVERLLDVRDNLRRALEDDHEDVESLREGVEMTLREFDRVLDEENVSEIAPEPGEEIDPSRHEVMMRVDADVPEDTVADLYAPGYEMADRVIRPAQVTVSTGAADGADDEGVETDEEGAEAADDDGVEADGEAADGGESAPEAEEGAKRATAGESDDEEA